tara:strand:- start:135 stop:1034 length:900 start_codon:yes stop_codon:yes gene_type:complete
MKNYIFCYHGVAKKKDLAINPEINCNGKHITEEDFYKQIKFLSQNKNVISISDLKNEKNLKDENIIITFDDGFKNNLLAAEILDKFNLPCIFYLCGGNIVDQKMFWVDMLEDFILINKVKKFNFDDTNYNLDGINSRRKCLNEIKYKLKRFLKSKRDVFLDDLTFKYNYNPSFNFPLYELLNKDDVKSISSNNLFSIGGHTYYHDPMTTFDNYKDLFNDTKKTIETLEDITNSKIDNYSFPEGTDDFFDNKCIDILKKFNISFCPTAIEGINNRITLPNYNSFRIMVGFEKIKFPFLIN